MTYRLQLWQRLRSRYLPPPSLNYSIMRPIAVAPARPASIVAIALPRILNYASDDANESARSFKKKRRQTWADWHAKVAVLGDGLETRTSTCWDSAPLIDCRNLQMIACHVTNLHSLSYLSNFLGVQRKHINCPWSHLIELLRQMNWYKRYDWATHFLGILLNHCNLNSSYCIM